jgi:uncharacterized membrane protein
MEPVKDITIPLITDPLYIFGTLIFILAVLFAWAGHPKLGKVFKFFPLIVLCYFVPMALSNLGVIPTESAVYVLIKKWLLPSALILITLSVDIPGIIRLGPKLVIMFLAGTFGVVLGGVVSYYLLSGFIPESLRDEAWKGFAALTGSWIGGGANFLAVGESVKAGSDIMNAMVIADVAVANIWMAILLFFASREVTMDKKLGVDRTALDQLRNKVEKIQLENKKIPSLTDLLLVLAVGITSTAICTAIAKKLPDVGTVINGFTWVVILVTVVGVTISFTPLRSLEQRGANQIGGVFLYLLITTIGVSGDLRQISKMPIIVLIAAVWMLIHCLVIMGTRRLLKAPIMYAAVGSQANIGGVASAPVVAAAFHPAFSTVGVLLSVLGYVLGTYLGIAVGFVLQWIK